MGRFGGGDCPSDVAFDYDSRAGRLTSESRWLNRPDGAAELTDLTAYEITAEEMRADNPAIPAIQVDDAEAYIDGFFLDFNAVPDERDNKLLCPCGSGLPFSACTCPGSRR